MILLFHISEKYQKEYSVKGQKQVHICKGGLSSSYDYLKQWSLRDFAKSQGWKEGEPLILIGWSAGCFPIRNWLLTPDAREIATAVMLLDGLHSAGPPCRKETIAGVLAYNHFANTNPSKHLFINTWTQIDPKTYASTASCASLLVPGPGSILLGYSGTDAEAHMKQLQIFGPELMDSIRGMICPSPRGILYALVAAVAGLIGYQLVKRK